MKRSLLIPCGFVVAFVFILCCCLLLAVGIASLNIFSQPEAAPTFTARPIRVTPTDWINELPTIQPPQLVTATPPSPNNTNPSPTPTGLPLPTSEPQSNNPPVNADTLGILEDTIVPVNDLADLAQRFLGIESIPETLPAPKQPYRIGDQSTFWASNTDTNENFQVDATLRYVTDHAYFWIEDGVLFDDGDLRDLMETFETRIYPTNREFFGSEWTPGVDSDPHLYILFAGNLGANLAGYFSSADEYHPLAHEYSNAHEMFLLNSE